MFAYTNAQQKLFLARSFKKSHAMQRNGERLGDDLSFLRMINHSRINVFVFRRSTSMFSLWNSTPVIHCSMC